MDELRQEMLDQVFHYIWGEEKPLTERPENLSETSVRTVLGCRLVARR